MSRDDGFQMADVDVGLLRDVKVRRIRQLVPDDAAATTLLYIAVVLSSWEEGYRLTADEADSPEAATPKRVAALIKTGLLDDAGRVPLATWESWFRPAWDRREKKRAGGLEGNRRRWQPDGRPSHTESVAESHSESESESLSGTPSVRPSVPPSEPSVPSVPGAARQARPPSARQVVHQWLSERGAAAPVGWVNTTLNELVKIYGPAEILATWARAPADVKTSRQFVQYAERCLSPGVNGSNGRSLKSNGNPGLEAVKGAFHEH